MIENNVKYKTNSTQHIFKWWCEKKINDNPHWKLRGNVILKSEGTLYYIAHEHYNFLGNKIFETETEIMNLEIADNNPYVFSSKTRKIFSLRKEVSKMEKKRKELSKMKKDTEFVVMTYPLFKEIISRYNKKISEEIVKGKGVYLGAKLGYIKIRSLKPFSSERLKENKGIPLWPDSFALRDQIIREGDVPKSKENPDGKEWIVFAEGPHFRWAWIKNMRGCRVAGHQVYGFYPTKGINGNKKKLINHIRSNPMATLNYEMRS